MLFEHCGNIIFCANFVCEMRKWVIFLLFIAGTAITDARTMKDFLVCMPSRVQNILTRDNWLDCVDFIASGMKASVKNNFGEVSTLIALSDNYVHLEVSPASEMEFKLLPGQKDSLIFVVRTYQLASASDSELHVYDSKWREIVLSTVVKSPTVVQFCKKSISKLERQRVLDAFHPVLITSYLDEKSNDLTFKLYANASNGELMKEMNPFLFDSLVYEWNGKQFVLKKEK